MKKYVQILALACIAILSGCHKDRDLFTPDPGKNYQSYILGLVLDEAGKPVTGASVNFNGNHKTTDKNGIYNFNNVDVSSVNNLIKISKAGYFEASRAFNTQKNSTINLKNILLKEDFNLSFTASTGGTISDANFEINFPSDVIVIESSNENYNGLVKVAVKYLDPTLELSIFKMPGRLSGINLANAISSLNSYGILAVELKSTSGEKLQIKSGKQVELSVKVPSNLLTNAHKKIPTWYFDESTGFWKEEESGELINDTYKCKVSHFSWWFFASSNPSINISGKVIDQNGNPVECTIWFTENGLDWGGSYGETNADGSFSGAIYKDTPLKLSIRVSNSDCNSVDYTAQVGPFPTDFVIEDITINLPNQSNVSCNGTFKNCSGNLIQSGYLKIVEGNNSHYFPITNGIAMGSYNSCANSLNLSVSGIDLSTLNESDITYLTGAGPHDLGEVNVCTNVADYFSIKNYNLNIDEKITYQISTIDSAYWGLSFVKSIWVKGDINSVLSYLNISYGDSSTNNTYSTGNYNITYGVLSLKSGDTYQLIDGTVNINQGGSTGNNLVGSYSINMKNDQTQAIENFSGSFKYKLD